MTASKALPAVDTPDAGGRVSFVARQPIFTSDEKVFGYELLFRDGVEDYFRETDADSASRRTLDTSLQIGLEVLCDGRRGFVNCTRDVLLKDYMTLLPSTLAVAEVLESVPPDDLVIAGLQRLKQAGYLIALDDFTINDPRTPLTEMADIIKVDVRATKMEDCIAIAKKHGPWRCRLLAEKVETREEFAAVKAAGFIYFQGYFFRRPEVLHTKEIPANRLNQLRLLKAVSQQEMDVRELETIIKQEASVCYRLLRYLNSAAFGIQNEIHSIRHALTLLGEREVRRWVRLVATLTAGEKKSSELLVSAMVRARFCELLSPKVPHGESDLFLMGLLSVIDAILEIPMIRVVEAISVDHETKAVLLGAASKLRPLYDLMLARESGDWVATTACAKQLNLSEGDVAQAYWQAMQWARQINCA
ncbi:MAG: diguanylate phosphodiesterase [Acidobacteria bacterium]|nr:MAG: diguanylate phosphodiesterase [Acidobacteriota bacterium]